MAASFLILTFSLRLPLSGDSGVASSYVNTNAENYSSCQKMETAGEWRKGRSNPEYMSPTARPAKSNSPEQNEINVTLRELHRFASYSQDHGNVDIRSFSI